MRNHGKTTAKKARPNRRRPKRREFNVVIERDADGWFVGTVPQLRGCHTQARSLDTLIVRMREAIALCLEDEDAPESAEFVGVQRIAVEA